MNIIKKLFVKQELPSADSLATLNLDEPFVSNKYAKKVIRHLANAIVETNRHFKYQQDVRVIFNCSYSEGWWVGGSSYYIPIKTHDNEIDFEAKVITELKSKGYIIANRQYTSDTHQLYFTINWK